MDEPKYLDNFSAYGFTRDGKVYNHRTKRLIGNVKPDSYASIAMRSDDGSKVRMMRHRVIAELFVSAPPSDDSVVNHINGIKGDDRVENLEWTTYRGNLEHAGALGLTTKCLSLLVRDVVTGSVTRYPSAASVARDFLLTKDAVLWRVRSGPARVFPEGKQYSLDVPNVDWGDCQTVLFGRDKATLVLDIVSGKEHLFPNQTEAAVFTGVCDSVISSCVSDNDQRLIKKRFLIKDGADATPWRQVTDVLLESKTSKAITVTCFDTGVQHTYPTLRECAMAHNLKPSTLCERLKRGNGKVYPDGFIYTYYTNNGPALE